MNTLLTVSLTLLVLTVIELAALAILYRRRHELLPMIKDRLGIIGLASSYLNLQDDVLRNERSFISHVTDSSERYGLLKKDVEALEAFLKEAQNTGADEVIDLGRRIDEVSDTVTAMKPVKKSKKVSKSRR